MKCQNCKIVIDSKFGFAIRSNKCPACGKYIMDPEKMFTYTRLKNLLHDNISEKEVDIDKIVSLVIANFEIKQLFKEELKKPDEEGIIKVGEGNDVVIVEEEEEEEDPDAESKAIQKKQAKDVLQKMRDTALDGALQEKYGLGGEGLLLADEENNMHEVINRHKQEESLNAVIMGTANVRRSEP